MLRPYSSISKCQHKAQKKYALNQFFPLKKTVNLHEIEKKEIEREKKITTTQCNYIFLPLRLTQCYWSIFAIVTKPFTIECAWDFIKIKQQQQRRQKQ